MNITKEQLALKFHETYERLAPEFGYETRSDTKKFDPESNNGRLMIAVCEAIMRGLEDAAPVPLGLDAIRQALEERDAMERDCELLANDMVYKGNSVSWWHSKAMAYRNAIDDVWMALKAAGIRADGKKTCSDGVRELAATSPQAAKGAEPVARVAEVHMSRYTLEWLNGPLPEGTELYTSPQAAQTALKSESSAQAAQALARLPSEGKPIEALAPTEAQEREARVALATHGPGSV